MSDPLTFETLEFYRPWCRYCGASSGLCVFADDQEWVQDEDDIGYPFCSACIQKWEVGSADPWDYPVGSVYRDYRHGSTHPGCEGDTDLCPDRGCKRCQGQVYDNGMRGRIKR